MGPKQVARLVAGSRGLPGLGGLSPPCAQIPTRQGPIPLVTERLVAPLTASGLQVHVWTIDDPAEMTRLLDLGVDGIMTDRPQVLRQVLEDRGDWTAVTSGTGATTPLSASKDKWPGIRT